MKSISVLCACQNQEKLERLFNDLAVHGQITGPFMQWHNSRDHCRWIVAEQLLIRTTRVAAVKAYQDLIQQYPKPNMLAIASIGDVRETIGWLGLGNQRSKT